MAQRMKISSTITHYQQSSYSDHDHDRKSKLNKSLKQNNQLAMTETDWLQQQQIKNISSNKQQWQISDCNSTFTMRIQHSIRVNR